MGASQWAAAWAKEERADFYAARLAICHCVARAIRRYALRLPFGLPSDRLASRGRPYFVRLLRISATASRAVLRDLLRSTPVRDILPVIFFRGLLFRCGIVALIVRAIGCVDLLIILFWDPQRKEWVEWVVPV